MIARLSLPFGVHMCLIDITRVIPPSQSTSCNIECMYIVTFTEPEVPCERSDMDDGRLTGSVAGHSIVAQ